MSTETGDRRRASRGEELARALRYAAAWLERHAGAIDALNVFPVPDGDTGLNMSVTLRAAVTAADEHDGGLGAVAQAAARGALMGARGNSGVILSQLLRGFADQVRAADELTAVALASGLTEGARAAYQAVLEPVEGTILTVARGAAEAAREAVERGAGLEDTLAAACRAAAEAVERTPDQLAVLREAGVVDAGGRGLAVVLDGLLRGLRDEPLDAAPLVADSPWRAGQPAQALPRVAHEEEHGYCTEFVVTGSGLDAAAIREAMGGFGGSVVVVGDATAVHVHLHTPDPGRPLSYATQRGALTWVKIENMDEQRAAVRRQAVRSRIVPPAQPEAAAPLVAVVAGDGFAELYRSLGATCLLTDQQATNPSVAELGAAIAAVDGPDVLVLPNDPNVALAAEQAARQGTKSVLIVPTRDMAEGLAALVAYSPVLSAEANATAMRQALDRTRTARVTWAARDAAIGGVAVASGAVLALDHGGLIAHGADLAAVVVAAVGALGGDSAELITLYSGRRVAPPDAAEVAARLRARWPQTAVEVVEGRQPHDFFLLAVE